MSRVVADTHAIIWYLDQSKRLSDAARDAMLGAASTDGIVIPAIALVEIVYLIERQRIPATAASRLSALLDQDATPFVVASLDRAIAENVRSVPRQQVPEMADRIIAATALALGLPLVTADAQLRAADITTIW